MARYGIKRRFVKTVEAVTYASIKDAKRAAQELANEIGDAVSVVDMAEFPRAKALRGSASPRDDEVETPRKRRSAPRVAVETETGRAPANKRRTGKRGGMPASKLEGLMTFFNNPSPGVGDFYFIDPRNGDYYTGRDRRSVASAAQRMATATGQRIAVHQMTVGERRTYSKHRPRR